MTPWGRHYHKAHFVQEVISARGLPSPPKADRWQGAEVEDWARGASQDGDWGGGLSSCVWPEWSQWPLNLQSDFPEALSLSRSPVSSPGRQTILWWQSKGARTGTLQDLALLLAGDQEVLIDKCSQPTPLSQRSQNRAHAANKTEGRQPPNILKD